MTSKESSFFWEKKEGKTQSSGIAATSVCLGETSNKTTDSCCRQHNKQSVPSFVKSPPHGLALCGVYVYMFKCAIWQVSTFKQWLGKEGGGEGGEGV